MIDVMSEEYGGLISENITTLPLPVEEPTGDHFLQKMSHSDWEKNDKKHRHISELQKKL